MSRFEEMCKAFGEARKAATDYQQRCLQITAQLVTGFRKYCEIPAEEFEIVPADKEPEGETKYHIPSAIQFDSETGFWRIGIITTLRETPNTLVPTLRVRVTIAVAESEGKTLVRLGWDSSPREIDVHDEYQCKALYDSTVDRIMQFIAKKPQDLVEKPISSKIISLRIQ